MRRPRLGVKELTAGTLGGCRALRIPREPVSADGVVPYYGGWGGVLLDFL